MLRQLLLIITILLAIADHPIKGKKQKEGDIKPVIKARIIQTQSIIFDRDYQEAKRAIRRNNRFPLFWTLSIGRLTANSDFSCEIRK